MATESTKLSFVLQGFKQVSEFRIFTFERIEEDWSRTPFTVKTDLALSRSYGIRLQELPLLCAQLLRFRSEIEDARAFTYTEDDMRTYANGCAVARDANMHKKRTPPRPSPSTAARPSFVPR